MSSEKKREVFEFKKTENFRFSVKGFTLVEFILAVSVFVIIATVASSAVMQSGKIDQKGNLQEKAYRYSQEGLEAVRSIRNQSFSSLASGTYGLSSVGGTWSFSGIQNYNDSLMRSVTISDVYRDTGGNVVSSGGTLDADTKKATINVTWKSDIGKHKTITEQIYLTNFRKSLGCNSWNAPIQESGMTIGNAHEGWKVKSQGNYAYVTFSSGGTDFAVIDISDTSNPYVRSTLNLNSSNLNNLAVQGNYAYLASDSTAHELKVINISNPDNPSIVSTTNIPKSANSNGIYLVSSTLFVTRDESTDKELYIFDVSDPLSPSLRGTFEIGVTTLGIYVSGNYAYVATASDTQELMVLDISNLSSISKKSSYNIANSTADVRSITGYNNRIYLGLDNGGVYILDVANPSSPQFIGLYSTSGSVNDMFFLSDPSCLFLATNNSSDRFKIIDVSNPASPTLIGSSSLSAELNGVAYDSSKNKVFLTTSISGIEFVVMKTQ